MSGLKIKHIGMAVLGLGLLSYFAYALAPRPVPVDLASVILGPMQTEIAAEGYTRAREDYVLSAPVSGTLLRIESNAGDEVVAGLTQLATLLPRSAEMLDPRSREQAEASVHSSDAAVVQANAQVRMAMAQLRQAQDALQRAEPLRQDNSIPEAELVRLKRSVDAAKAAFDAATATQALRRAQRENAQALLRANLRPNAGSSGSMPLLAPVSGKVLKVHQENESLVMAGTPLLEIADPHDLEIVVDLLSQDAVTVPMGATVRIEDWGGDVALEGKVVLVEPYGFTKVSALGIEEQRVNVVIALLTPRAQREALGHGYRVNANIVIWQTPQALQVPVGALFRVDQQWSVFELRDGRAELVSIQIGQHNGLQAEVLQGLKENTQVLLHPSEQVQAGRRIALRQ